MFSWHFHNVYVHHFHFRRLHALHIIILSTCCRLKKDQSISRIFPSNFWQVSVIWPNCGSTRWSLENPTKIARVTLLSLVWHIFGDPWNELYARNFLPISCFELNQKVSNRYTITNSPSLGTIVLVQSIQKNLIDENSEKTKLVFHFRIRWITDLYSRKSA